MMSSLQKLQEMENQALPDHLGGFQNVGATKIGRQHY
jgi:hypothetical protein